MQVTMSEEAYQDETAEVSLKLSQPHVRDVWEERMPLALEAALSVGCVASVAPAVRSRPLSEGYELVELQVCYKFPKHGSLATLALHTLCTSAGCLQSKHDCSCCRPRDLNLSPAYHHHHQQQQQIIWRILNCQE